MRSWRCLVGLLLVGLLLVGMFMAVRGAAAQDTPQKDPAAAKEADAAQPVLPLVFDEDITDFNRLFREFKTVGSGEQELSLGKSWTWKTGVSIVRPVQVGTQAELSLRLQFPPLKADGDAAETQLGLVLAHGQVGMLSVARKRAADKNTATLSLSLVISDKLPPKRVRSSELDEDVGDGAWIVRLRSGALVVEREGKELLAGCLDTRDVPLAGVSFSQPTGQVTVQRVTLHGTAFPAAPSDADAATLKDASSLNEEAARHYRNQQFAEAETKAKSALELYRRVHKEGHRDLSNSLYNVAVVLRDAGKKDDAIPYLDEAIGLRRRLLGEDHPDTAQLELELAALYVGLGRVKSAVEPCLRAHFSCLKYYGSDHDNTRRTQGLLDKLPKP